MPLHVKYLVSVELDIKDLDKFLPRYDPEGIDEIMGDPGLLDDEICMYVQEALEFDSKIIQVKNVSADQIEEFHSI